MKKLSTFSDWLFAVILTAVIVMMAVGMCSCTSTKKVTKTSKEVDSTAVKELLDSVRLMKVENETLVETINEMSYGVIRFDTVYLKGDTVRNTVTITKDGEVKATGNILTAYVSKTVLTKILTEKQKIIDSLSLVKQTEKVRVILKTVTVDREKKTVMFPWYLLVIAAAAFVVVFLLKRMSIIK